MIRKQIAQIKRVNSKSKLGWHEESQSNVLEKIFRQSRIFSEEVTQSWNLSCRLHLLILGIFFKLEFSLIKYPHSFVMFAPVGLKKLPSSL